jgi:hypothetical protein
MLHGITTQQPQYHGQLASTGLQRLVEGWVTIAGWQDIALTQLPRRVRGWLLALLFARCAIIYLNGCELGAKAQPLPAAHLHSTSMAPSSSHSARSTSMVKSTCPGVSGCTSSSSRLSRCQHSTGCRIVVSDIPSGDDKRQQRHLANWCSKN